MVLSFEIIYVYHHHNRGQFIFAKLLTGESGFEVKDGIFGGIPIYNYVEMPRMLDENGEQRLDVFVFCPIEPMQKGNFVQGQCVELVLPNQ
ncbi:hypothetical protein OC25_20035 [Pedobacter kyungheensis]|uniref:Uncharacterized protein n=1 Tax=Pedobacter kyungheensis TaxID=1069985 RepID=A0A0C1FUY7_9SPHI|nr:hypothetical protein [Pedobacter kyungheensis]KIA91659.1 hypothetical protein OC25_20035 [Pedobacter kyungheensis]